jgi:hypothetical protein
MGDEKVPADAAKKDDKPPAVTKPSGPEQQTGPGRATEKKPEEKKPDEKKPPAGAVPAPTTPPKQAAEQATQLQHSVGNQEANRLMRAAREAPGAPAVPVSHPDDKAEKEAEAVAKKVTEERPAHPHDNPAPAHGDPPATHGDPHEITGDPEHERGTVHRAARPGQAPQAPKPPPAAGQTKGPAMNSPTATLDHPGPGEPIPQPTRGILERRLNVKLSHVVIHHDAKADEAVRALHARAVTRGNHIWLASDASPTDLNLMAHEVAHVLQHDNHVVHRKATGLAGTVVHRAPSTTGKEEKKDEKKDVVDVPNPKGTINIENKQQKTVVLDELKVPAWRAKAPFIPNPIKWRNASESRSGKQRSIWLSDDTNKSDAAASLRLRLAQLGLSPDGIVQLQGRATKRESSFLYTGRVEDIAPALVIPPWSRSGEFARWEVDHKAEWQIGGEDNKVENLWLLDPEINNKSGNFIKNSIREQLKNFLDEANKTLTRTQTVDGLKGKTWSVTWKGVRGEGGVAPNENQKWDRPDIATVTFMAGLEKLAAGRSADDVKGREDRLAIYPQPGGGIVRHVTVNKTGEGTYKSKHGGSSLKRIKWELPGPNSESTNGKRVGSVTGDVLKDNKTVAALKDQLVIPILGMPGVDYGGALDKETIRNERKRLLRLKRPKLSPIEFDELDWDLDSGLTGRGRIPKPEVKLLEQASIFVIINDDEIGVEATITGDELLFPGPFKIAGGAITLRGTDAGVGIDGRIDFEIEKLAKGYIAAAADAKKDAASFELEGKLMFDTKMFTKAELGLSYKDSKWGVSGELAVGPDKIKGIKSASARVDVKDETVNASGEFETSIKGIEKGTLGFKYQEATGMEITGAVQFGKGIPGIKSGNLDATIAKKPDNQWSLAAKGSAQPAIPGVDATLSASYEDGIFTIEGQAAYAKGKLSGTLQIGVTNKPVDAEGKPGGGKPGKELRAYGGGTVTIKITPWLQGTVGVMLKPEGGIKLSGEIALPDAVDLFPRKEINKNILEIGVDIPIIGVAVAGQRVGIFATVKGGLDAFAGVGPAQLRELGLKIEYDPDHEEDTTITGTAKLAVPANAGIRLYVKGGVGVGIPIVSAEAGLEVGGSLALEGAVEAGVTVNWSPSKGLKIDAEASVHAEPKLKFDVTAYVDVKADFLVGSVTLYENKWKLAAVEYGSGLRVGVRAPVHYEEGKPFEFDPSKVEFEVPKIDPLQVIGGLVKQITGG